MAGMTRRRFLGSAAAAVGTAGLAQLPWSMRKALAAPARDLAHLREIEHVVILTQENRSFDHYFGTLSGVRGFDDPDLRTLPSGRSVFYQPDALNPDGYVLPFHLDTTTTNAAAIHDPGHGWPTLHQAWNGGTMDNWVPSQRAAVGAFGPLTMGYFTRNDLPLHYALADAFTICDHYFCSVMGPTWPNRLHTMTGTIDPTGANGGPNVATNSLPPSGGFTWTTYAERLQAAGISWRSYQSHVFGDGPELGWFKQFQTAPAGSPLYENGMKLRPKTAIMDDIRTGNLPQVSWLQSEADEHPSGLPAAGGAFIYDLLDALASTPEVWNKTVLFITYDENGGFFDHVTPPTPPPGTPGEFLTTLPRQAGGIAGPIGMGFRVPTFVISPWSRGGWVAGETFDHTSLLRFLEVRFGVREPNISAWRRQTAGDLTSTLRFPRRDVPFPALPDPAPVVARQKEEAATLPDPSVPAAQSLPHQEPGTRPRL
ncbi:alkaline phosphatase family protein [Kribbella sp.]|uniref:alkaline phosphatase family protein n=1 Tax=Kribbella sp. TaxID=1871183 RepID=UPI002D575581|nr:alkaline phosphatase family protein [Kribbella sp.]HZX07674.1 alkaline phosphatase family protein [Kribbella sp.]